MESIVTPCSGGECIEITAIGADWFRIHSTINRHINVAVTGAELRAFFDAVKTGVFDELAAPVRSA